MAPIEEVKQQSGKFFKIITDNFSKFTTLVTTNTNVMIAFLVALLLCIIYLPSFNLLGSSTDRTLPKSTFERFDNQPEAALGDVEVNFFYVNWCGYCKEAKPHFTEFMEQNNSKIVNGKKIKIKMIDCEANAENRQLAKNMGINGYPTITAKFGNRLEKYEGERTLHGLNSWMNQF